jgi:hypothetical protein
LKDKIEKKNFYKRNKDKIKNSKMRIEIEKQQTNRTMCTLAVRREKK